MSEKLQTLIGRLNSIKERISTPTFLSNGGIGNEVPYYVFDYPPEFELEVRDHLKHMLHSMETDSNAPSVLALNLFSVTLDYLKARDCYDEVLTLERENGSDELLDALHDVLNPEDLCEFISDTYKASESDVVFLTGVGECWPFLRAHSVLNNLQTFISTIPVILFYPGEYDGQCFHPFGLPVGKANYYRAFRLVN